MAIPNGLDVVRQTAGAHPREFAEAHRGGPGTEDFIRRVAWVLHSTVDPRFGLNGKRGNPNDISDDAICYDGESLLGDVDPTRGNAPVTVFDVIGSAGTSDARPQWGAVGPATPQPHAAWVKPSPVGQAQPAGPSLWTAAHSAELAKLGAPAGDLDAAFTERVAEHFAAVFPAEGWGQKRASSDRPVSGDVIARSDGARLLGFKVVPLPSGAPAQMDITGQTFVPVHAVNHAPGSGQTGGGGETGGGEAPPVLPPTVFDAIVAALAVLNQGVAEASAQAERAAQAAERAATAAEAAKQLAEKLKGQKFQVKGLPKYFGSPTIEPQP